jgi:hypothetical protein
MGEERYRGRFVAMTVIMFVLFLSLISIVFGLTGRLFVFELLLLLLFLLLGIAFTAGTYYGGDWIWKALLVFFGANLINLSFLYFVKISFGNVILPITVGVVGFLVALVKKGSEKEDLEEIEDIKTEPEAREGKPSGPQESLILEEKKEEKKIEDIKVNFSPGKYIASETGKKYHIPKCDWAKKINKKRIIWFDDKKEAKKKGYLPCKCVK